MGVMDEEKKEENSLKPETTEVKLTNNNKNDDWQL
jgi:hypothetical protein